MSKILNQSIKDKELLTHYANEFGDSNILKVIESGVSNEEEAADLARFYWKIVDETVEKKDLEHILEKYTRRCISTVEITGIRIFGIEKYLDCNFHRVLCRQLAYMLLQREIR